jgi:hypothetical protein
VPSFRFFRFALVVPLLAPLAPLVVSTALAQTSSVTVELNKLEAVDGGCRAFFVVRNDGDTAFESLDLDLVTFRPDGVVGARFQVELAPLAADKTVVKPFDFGEVDCEDIDRVLLNAVVACAPPEPAACLELIEPTSLAAEFFK